MVRNWEGEIVRKIGRLGDEDRDVLIEYDEEMRAAELSPATRAAQVHAVAHLVDPEVKGSVDKSLAEIERGDLVSWLARSELSPVTKANRILVLRKFFKWLTGQDNPDVVQGIKVRRQKGMKNGLQHGDLLDEKEVQAMIQASENPRDRALLALMWDSGARLGEIIALKVGDVSPHPRYSNALRVSIRESKTEARELALFDCRYWVVRWLSEHPSPGVEEAPLFPTRGSTKPLGEMGVRRVVRLASARAKASGAIPGGKRVYPHLFRHSRSTDLLSRGYSETKLKPRQGWDMNTRMIARYTHLSELAAEEEDARLHGEVKEEERRESALSPARCTRCGDESPPQAMFCHKCGMALTEEAAAKMDEAEEAIVARLERLEKLLEEKLN